MNGENHVTKSVYFHGVKCNLYFVVIVYSKNNKTLLRVDLKVRRLFLLSKI